MKSNFPKIPLFLSISFFIISLLALVFLYKEVNKNNMELADKESAWQKEALHREGIKKLEHSVKVISEERSKLETHFAESSDVVPFLDKIEELGREVGVKAEVTSVDISKEGNGLDVIMGASGTFGSLYKFLTLLENSSYIMDMKGVELHKETSGDKTKVSENLKWNGVFKIKLLSFVQ